MSFGASKELRNGLWLLPDGNSLFLNEEGTKVPDDVPFLRLGKLLQHLLSRLDGDEPPIKNSFNVEEVRAWLNTNPPPLDSAPKEEMGAWYRQLSAFAIDCGMTLVWRGGITTKLRERGKVGDLLRSAREQVLDLNWPSDSNITIFSISRTEENIEDVVRLSELMGEMQAVGEDVSIPEEEHLPPEILSKRSNIGLTDAANLEGEAKLRRTETNSTPEILHDSADDNQVLHAIQELRQTCLGHLVFKERIIETGVPAGVLASHIFDEFLSSFRFVWVECDGHIEFWQPPEPTSGDEYASVCAVLIEPIGNKLKVNFGSFSFLQQTMKAARDTSRSSVGDAAAATMLLGPTAGIVAGLAGTAIGAGVSLVNKALEKGFWNRVNGILRVLAPTFPFTPDQANTRGSVLDRLEQLVRIRETGALEPVEFERLKAEILASNTSFTGQMSATGQTGKSPSEGFSTNLKLIKCAPQERSIAGGELPAEEESQISKGGFGSGCVEVIMQTVSVMLLLGWLIVPSAFAEGNVHLARSGILMGISGMALATALYLAWRKRNPQ